MRSARTGGVLPRLRRGKRIGALAVGISAGASNVMAQSLSEGLELANVSNVQGTVTAGDPETSPEESRGVAPEEAEATGGEAENDVPIEPTDIVGPEEHVEPIQEADVEPFAWHWLPPGLIYRSYLAGVKEPRMYVQATYVKGEQWYGDMAVGGRIGIVRFGNTSGIDPHGFQIDFETAGMGRLDVNNDIDLRAVDLRIGAAFTYRLNAARLKLSYYHLSSHVGDEFLLEADGFNRINYARDVLVAGVSYFITPAVMPYFEVGYAVRVDGGAEQWELQLGVDVSPAKVGLAPFAAVNGYVREDVDFSGNVVLQAGGQLRSPTGRRLRFGGQYLAGKSPQFSFLRSEEISAGIALWYDF